jgi:prepilin-type N-terminal cleavage/methylation domain-containing protein
MKVFSSTIQKGFTLVEMLVAIAIFMIVVTTTLGAFLKMVDVNKKVQSVRNAMDNANLAMETMMRNLRLGYDYCQVGPSCTQNSISFRDQSGNIVTYNLEEGPIAVGQEVAFFQMKRTINNGSSVAITSPDIGIEDLQFEVVGGSILDAVQAHVKIFVKGKTLLPKNEHNFEFSFQSLATQRLYDK